MHPLAAASRSRLLATEPKLFVFETSYYAFCGRYCFESVASNINTALSDIALNYSIRNRKPEWRRYFLRNRTNWTCMLFLLMYTFMISIYSDSLFHSCLRCLIAGKDISCSTTALHRTVVTPHIYRHLTSVVKVYFHFKLSNVSKRANLYGIVLFPSVCCFLRCTLSL